MNGPVEHYNKMINSLDKRVLPTKRKFEDLSIAPPDKKIPDPKRIEASADTGSGTLDLLDMTGE